MSEIFVDSSIFVSHCMIGDETLIKLLKGYDIATSPNVIEESFYKSLYLKTEDIYGKSGKYLLKEKYSKRREHYKEIYEYFSKFIRQLIDFEYLRILPLNSEIILTSIEISWKYNLLPNDALIAATCRYYGINKIATFDEDFKKVEFLEIIEV